MTDITAYLAAAVFVGFAVYRLSAAGAGETQRYICAFALCIGSALVLNAPTSIAALSRLMDARTLLVALVHGLKMGAFTCLALIALTLRNSTDDRTPVHRHVGAGIGVQALSGWLFAASAVTVTSDAVSVGDGRRLLFAGYELLFACYGIACLTMLIGALAGHIRREAAGAVRAGLVLMALSAAVGVLWTGWSAHDMTAVLRTGRQGLGEDLPSTCFGVVIALLAACGSTANRWPALLGPLRWWRARRSYRALEPLWSALCTEVPEIALYGDGTRGRTRPRQATFALYRRVIEIRDAHLALRPYFDPGRPDPAAAGHPAREAAREAAAITAALANRRNGRRPDAGGPGSEPVRPWPVAGTLAAETDWLLQVTHAFVHHEDATR
ncbi:MAB_1171c family putative transporter [Streptomyces sp. IBSBF 2435]|uniref:MAB_1171c family putative transporter n=1 Tax=Streptomyces sp. IBSBF 2435 TaxID=2903531 RepID=UPI002FDBDBE5